MAACLAPGPVSPAIDNQSTLDFVQGIARNTREGVRECTRLRYGDSSVRLALERIVCQKGKGAVASLKVKAHVDPGSPEAHITAPGGAFSLVIQQSMRPPQGAWPLILPNSESLPLYARGGSRGALLSSRNWRGLWSA